MAVLMVATAYAQKQNPRAFDVASVKPTPADHRYELRFEKCPGGGRFVVAGAPLMWTISFGFRVPDGRIAGGPAWLNSFDDSYDIEAKAEGRVTEDECRLMVQSLLAERFELKAHRETREALVYALIVGKGAPRLRESGGVKINGAVQQALSEQEAPSGWSMRRFADYLSDFAGRTVVDKTGLEGTYGFDLSFARAETDDRPNLFAALQDQLGLKLEPQKAAIDVLVIDHVARAAAN